MDFQDVGLEITALNEKRALRLFLNALTSLIPLIYV
jgi:hypothetical protein